MSSLKEFLQRNSIRKSQSLPLVHSTASYHLKSIISKNKIEGRPCDVFKGESLVYFFVGRAAYKKESPMEAEYWELPACVIMEIPSARPKRIFPFDTGAFSKQLYPSFINMMPLSQFEAENNSNSVKKMIGTFFLNSRNYYKLIPRSRQSFDAKFEIDVLDEEIQALHKLIEVKNERFDDRRFAIEWQSDGDVSFEKNKVLAVIMPENYLTSEKYMTKIMQLNAHIITYPVFQLRKQYYYSVIYEKIYQFYEDNRMW